MVTIEQEILIDGVTDTYSGRKVDTTVRSIETLIKSLMDKIDELEREIEQLKEMMKR